MSSSARTSPDSAAAAAARNITRPRSWNRFAVSIATAAWRASDATRLDSSLASPSPSVASRISITPTVAVAPSRGIAKTCGGCVPGRRSDVRCEAGVARRVRDGDRLARRDRPARDAGARVHLETDDLVRRRARCRDELEPLGRSCSTAIEAAPARVTSLAVRRSSRAGLGGPAVRSRARDRPQPPRGEPKTSPECSVGSPIAADATRPDSTGNRPCSAIRQVVCRTPDRGGVTRSKIPASG